MAVEITVGDKKKNEPIKINLKIRKALDGSLMIYDHEDIDIVLKLDDGKIITFPSELMDEKTYDTQNRFFKYLCKRGITDPASVKAGNVYSSLEGKILNADDVPGAGDLVLIAISRWIDAEKPHFMYLKALEDQEEERLFEPDENESTELGEVPQAKRKGTLGARDHLTIPGPQRPY